MFGTNPITGKSFFKTAKSKALLVTSRFFTLQGEGPYRGQPAYFIRLAKCNLACSFCDTYFDEGQWQDFATLLSEADQVIADFFKNQSIPVPAWAQGLNKKMVLVITGGEPSLQKNLVPFLKAAQPYFQQIQIESNGVILLEDLPAYVTLVVSPKCLEKEGQAIRYLKPNPQMLVRADCLKFVLSSPEETRYQVYSEVPAWAQQWAKDSQKSIFISPMNLYKKEPQASKLHHKNQHPLSLEERSVINEIISFWEPDLLDMKKNQRNHEYAAQYCLKHGFIFNLQLHLYAGLA